MNYSDYKEIPNDLIKNWERHHYTNWSSLYKQTTNEIVHYKNDSMRFTDPIKDYCGWEGEKINYYLRKGEFDVSSEKYKNKLRIDIALLLWNIFESPPLPDNIIVYRMVPKFVIEKIVLSKIPWEEKGFMSVSLTQSIKYSDTYKEGFDILKIYVPKGTRVLCADILSSGENEFIFPPNCFLKYLHHTYRDEETKNNVFLCKLIQ